MIVTAIERTRGRRGRVDLWLDGVSRIELGRDFVRQQRLRPGDVLDPPRADALIAADTRREALRLAGAMLARRPHSEREVRRRLARHRFAPALIDDTIARLERARFIDDAEFARTWVDAREHASPRGRRLIVQELRARGVAYETARDAAAGISDAEAAYAAAARRAPALRTVDDQAFRTRLAGYLQRRGFSWEVTKATVDRCLREAGRRDRDDALDESVG